MPYDVDRVRQWCSQCLTDKRALPIEFQITRSDGEIRTVASTAEIVFDDDGQPIRLFGTIQDITDSRRAQQELFASQKLESLGMLASVIAHDFNNLLGGVLIHAEVALAELSAGANPVQELNTIRTTAIRVRDCSGTIGICGQRECRTQPCGPVADHLGDARFAHDIGVQTCAP